MTALDRHQPGVDELLDVVRQQRLLDVEQRDQLVGTWSFVIAEITAADGKKSLPFGDKPKVMIIFTADGHFSQVHVAGGLPKIASNNRLAGTAEDIIAQLKAVEERYPGLDRVVCATPLGTPLDVQKLYVGLA